MRTKARHHLEEQLQRLGYQREETKRKLRALARQERHERQTRCGELVELAGLADVEQATPLGGLCALAEMLSDQDTVSRWETVGETKLEAYRQGRVHRKTVTLSPT